MLASGGKGGGETFKKPGPVMAYGRGLSMHQPPAHDFPAEMLSNRLMAQANAQQRLSNVSASGDKVKRNPRFVGCAWSRCDPKCIRAGRKSLPGRTGEIGRAKCRERGCQNV